MKKWLAILLLCLLPLQFAWAAVAPYCFHAAAQGEGHIGHHEHQDADATADAAGGESPDELSHPECGSCHGSVAVINEQRAACCSQTCRQLTFAPNPDQPLATLHDRPERPNWFSPSS